MPTHGVYLSPTTPLIELSKKEHVGARCSSQRGQTPRVATSLTFWSPSSPSGPFSKTADDTGTIPRVLNYISRCSSACSTRSTEVREKVLADDLVGGRLSRFDPFERPLHVINIVIFESANNRAGCTEATSLLSLCGRRIRLSWASRNDTCGRSATSDAPHCKSWREAQHP